MLAWLGQATRTGRGRWLVVLAAAVGAATWAAWLISVLARPGPLDLAGTVKGADFIEFYTAGRIVASGAADRLYDLDLQERMEHALTAPAVWSGFHGFINPPWFAFLFVPFARLPYTGAFVAWSTIGLALLALSLRMLGRTDFRTFAWALAFVPVFAALSYGQNSFLSLFLLSATFVLLRDEHDAAAGATLGGLLYKPQLTAVIAFLLFLEGRWAAIVGFGATAAACLGVTLATSVPAARGWLELTRSFPTLLTTPGFPIWKMHSLYSFFALALPGRLAVAEALAVVASVATLVIARRLQPALREDPARWYAVAVWATLLVSPHVLLYDLTLLLLPWALGGGDDVRQGAVVAVWAATVVSQPLTRFVHATSGFGIQLSTPVLLAAGWVALRCGSAGHRAKPVCGTSPIVRRFGGT